MCGIFGVYAPGRMVAHLTYLGLYALQHRGQESAGMAVSDFKDLTVIKEMGLVSNVFDDRALTSLPGDIAVGQTRYSTTGHSQWRNAQPIYRGVGDMQFALGHNGNLVNTAELAEEAGMLPGTVASDSDLVGELVARELFTTAQDSENPLLAAMEAVLPRLQGAFCFSVMDQR